MLLLTGAGGKTGKTLIRMLSKTESVSAFVHREEQALVAKSLGAEKVIIGDLRQEAAIRSAMEGVRAVYHICPNMSPDELVIGKRVIDAARKCGVEHFVYHSVLHPQTGRMPHHWAKLRVEEMILESGLPFTILQPAPYMQNLLAGWESIVEDGILRVPYSVHSKFSFIDLEDLAEAARIVLMEPNHMYATYELAGTLPMSHVDVAERLGNVLKHNVEAEKEEIEVWKPRVTGISEYALVNLTRMFEYYDRWGLVGNPNVLKRLLKREPTAMESFLKRTVREQDILS